MESQSLRSSNVFKCLQFGQWSSWSPWWTWHWPEIVSVRDPPRASSAQAPSDWAGSSSEVGTHLSRENLNFNQFHHFQHVLFHSRHVWTMISFPIHKIWFSYAYGQQQMWVRKPYAGATYTATNKREKKCAKMCQATSAWSLLTSLWLPRVAHPKHRRHSPSVAGSPQRCHVAISSWKSARFAMLGVQSTTHSELILNFLHSLHL